jgi:ribosomal protein S17
MEKNVCVDLERQYFIKFCGRTPLREKKMERLQ